MTVAAVIATLDKNSRERVRVALDTYRDTRLIDLRIVVDLSGSSGIDAPTKKGISLRVEFLPELRRALAEAEARAREMGWIEGPATP
jgi:hypothetical protein